MSGLRSHAAIGSAVYFASCAQTSARPEGDLEREYALRAVTPMGTTYRLCLSEGDRGRFDESSAPHVVNGTRAVITRIEVDDNKDLKTIHARLLGGDESRGLLPDLSFYPAGFSTDEESRVRIAYDYAGNNFQPRAT